MTTHVSILVVVLSAVACKPDQTPAPAPIPQPAPSAPDAAKPLPVPPGFKAWLAETFEQPRCSFTIESTSPRAVVWTTATFTNRPTSPDGRWSVPITFEREGDGWTCHNPVDSKLDCGLLTLQCERHVPRLTVDEVAAANPAQHAPKCIAKSQELIRTGEECDLDMARYTPEQICAYYLAREQMPDDEIVERLSMFLERGCGGLEAAMVEDRI